MQRIAGETFFLLCSRISNRLEKPLSEAGTKIPRFRDQKALCYTLYMRAECQQSFCAPALGLASECCSGSKAFFVLVLFGIITWGPTPDYQNFFARSAQPAPCLCGCSDILYTLTHPHQTHSTMAGKRRRNSNGEDEVVNDTTHPSRKRRVEYGQADAKLAALYNDLSDEVKATRLKAAADLIRTLADADPEAIDRALTRLIRGLCSSRKAARSGFSVALIEIFKLTTKVSSAETGSVDLTLPAIIEKIVSITQPEEQSNNKVYNEAGNDSSTKLNPHRKEEITSQVVASRSNL